MANKEAIQKWVDALRSGKYQQGTGGLKPVGDRFCCLGVACDVSGVAQWNWNTYDGAEMTLPESVVDWLALESGSPAVKRWGADPVELWVLNDGVAGRKKLTFSEIADLIEKEWLA